MGMKAISFPNQLVLTLLVTIFISPVPRSPARQAGQESSSVQQKIHLRPLAEFEKEKLPHATLLWNPDFKADLMLRYRIRAAVMFDLELVAWQVPAEAWNRLGDVRIAISPKTEGPGVELLSSRGRGAEYHGDRQWLQRHGIDAERRGAIEIFNATTFLTNKPWHPMVMVHELTHRLTYLADPKMQQAIGESWARLVKSGRGEKVAHILAPPGELRPAGWVANGAGEYIAELAEAFWGRNAAYPFVRDDLISFDRTSCDLVARLWATTCEPRKIPSAP
jgi:hypothetical protein